MRFFHRQRYFIDFTLTALLRRKGKNIALLIVYTTIVFVLASVMLFTHALKYEASVVLQQSPEIILQRMIAGRHDLIPAEYIEKMGRIRGVTQKTGRLWGYFYDPAVKANYTLMADSRAAQPRTEGESERNISVTIGAGIARTRDLNIGDYLNFRSPASGLLFSLQIKEILSDQSELISTDLIIMSAPDLRTFFGIPKGYYTDIVLTVRNSNEVNKIAQKLQIKLPDTRPILRDEILRTYDNLFGWRQGILFVLLSSTVLAFVIFAWDKASGLSAEEKREIGILKATGWETSDILKMKFWEGGIISLTAFLCGYLLAYAHVFLASASIFSPVLKGWSTLYPNFTPHPFIDSTQIITLFFFTVFPYTLATLIPGWHAAITDPDTVMRQ